MFSKQIIDSDAFLDMPMSSQLLYFHLVMHADDEGFIGNPKKISRMVGVGDDDFKILVAKRFVITFKSGVIVIKHWLIHNAIRMDRFNKTAYQDERNLLITKENKAYSEVATNGIPNGNQMATSGSPKLSEAKLSKVKLSEVKKYKETERGSVEIEEIIKSFESINPACKKFYGNITQRKACSDLVKTYGFDRTKDVIDKTLPKTNGMTYFPTITTPVQLFDKWASLESKIRQYQSEKVAKNNKYTVI